MVGLLEVRPLFEKVVISCISDQHHQACLGATPQPLQSSVSIHFDPFSKEQPPGLARFHDIGIQ